MERAKQPARKPARKPAKSPKLSDAQALALRLLREPVECTGDGRGPVTFEVLDNGRTLRRYPQSGPGVATYRALERLGLARAVECTWGGGKYGRPQAIRFEALTDLDAERVAQDFAVQALQETVERETLRALGTGADVDALTSRQVAEGLERQGVRLYVEAPRILGEDVAFTDARLRERAEREGFEAGKPWSDGAEGFAFRVVRALRLEPGPGDAPDAPKQPAEALPVTPEALDCHLIGLAVRDVLRGIDPTERLERMHTPEGRAAFDRTLAFLRVSGALVQERGGRWKVDPVLLGVVETRRDSQRGGSLRDAVPEVLGDWTCAALDDIRRPSPCVYRAKGWRDVSTPSARAAQDAEDAKRNAPKAPTVAQDAEDSEPDAHAERHTVGAVKPGTVRG